MSDIRKLREHLFSTLEGLMDRDKPMEIDRAKAVAEIAQVIINSAKAETEHVKVVGGKATEFISGPGTTTHRLGG
ncbi:hypothetical protein LMG27177_01182 [Paraburkholderia fynbosensis]|uniref:Uncharacterized protein n=2 Tax=Paraburkholderia fynbosensis TaxID=1200993 RepID=A0A6J5FNM3_9BURK|nr:hypothetical protein LMG27177_01182 [Paraburkholderia fynbosensis]